MAHQRHASSRKHPHQHRRCAFGRNAAAAAGATDTQSGTSTSTGSTAEPAQALLRTEPFLDLDQYDGFLFDVDGTLTNSDDIHFLAFQELLQDKGYAGGEPITRQFFDAHIAGRHNPDIGAHLFPEESQEAHEKFSDEKEAYFRELALGKLQPIPGLGGLIVAIVSQQKPMVAVTNSTRDNVALMLDALQLSEAFESVIYGAECARAKPQPDPYLEGLKVLGVPKERAIVFEDSPAGVASGVAAGLRTVALATSQSVDTLAGLGASDVIADYRDILL